VEEKDRFEIVKEAIKSEEDFILIEEKLEKEESDLREKMTSAKKAIEEARANQELLRNNFASAMLEIENVYSDPETLRKFLDNGCRWARIFGGDVPPVYQDAFIRGEVLIGSLYSGGPYEGEPLKFAVEREGNKLMLVKYSTGDYWLARKKIPELKKLPQLREILAERDIEQTAI
jgi:hypothetical protein